MTAAAPVRAAPPRATGAKSTTSMAGLPMEKPTSTSWPWPVARTTAWSKRAAGPRGNAKTAAPNGSHHPQLDTGQSRVNDHHHPEKYLVDPEDEDL